MRNAKHFLALFIVFQALATQIHAQNTNQNASGNFTPEVEACGTSVLHDNLLRTNEGFRQRIALNENLIQTALRTDPEARTNQNTGQVLVIPLVVHIVHLGEAVGTGNNISDAQVNSAIVALNDIYRKKAGTYGAGGGVDMEIEFQLATRDPNCNPTTGIVRINGSVVPNYATQGIKLQSAGADDVTIKNLSRWPNTDYYNIWVVSEIDNGGGTAGYAYLPGAPGNLDGTVLLNQAFGTMGTASSGMNRGLTLAHELGHAFNLYHTFEGDNGGTGCPPVVNGCGSGQGDCVADTEPHRRSNSAYNWSCPAGAINTCTNAPIGNVYKNYMDYNSETCRTEFTQDQKDRVRAAISLFRPGLLNSQSLTTGSVSVPLAATCSPTGTVVSNNFSIGIYSVSIGNYTVKSDGTVGDNAMIVDRSCHQQFGLEGNAAFPISITTGPANNENVQVYLDYNSNGTFTDAGELVFNSANVRTQHNGTFSPPAGRSFNSALRLRVISDFAGNPITGPCYQPQYGQVEEYTVSFLSPLPVHLETFTAQLVQDQVLLRWKTAQETNNHYFEIERSGNSKDWQLIGKVNGSGNSSVPQAYTFTDADPIQGQNYYRLKQVDYDGRSEYSFIRSVANSSKRGSFTIYPNPGRGQFTIKSEKASVTPVHLRVFDTNGRLIYQQQSVQNEHRFSIEEHPSGMYLLEVISGKEVNRVKLVKE
ncbi:zinc-dependent metalloprotease [Adhaeribacter sp. BT258]|uniref:Zinc-dependent metalloprotease n=1 Tax=Adhaeribacter terrigena TaxID=2793070 RepID=A0ABS1C5G8_9BACT|nr:M43 family zinc metalloprotease [Adhaeribacter terrigena]MBK0404610.1 zinc-dependent metalloprotease [Adhaeribacter terrigena]